MEILRIIVETFGIQHMTVGQGIMIMVSLFFMYLAIVRKYEPLLLLPLAFGILIANLPNVGLNAYHSYETAFEEIGTYNAEGVKILPGLMNFLYSGIRLVIYPPLVFLCLGTMTDFSPLIANPRSWIIGIGGQLGIFTAFFISLYLSSIIPGMDAFTLKEAAAIGIIGSSDGPTAIYAATRLAPHLLPPIAIAAFSYMALVPFIQPPIMKLLTTKKERVIVMPEPKRVTQKQKIMFPIIVTIITLVFVPAAGALISMLMLGNLIRESGVADRYVRAFQNDLLSILTFLVALGIGSSARWDRFLTPQTLLIISCGLLAFIFGTIGGIMTAKLLCLITRGKVNPLIGNSGVSAMPMAARISQRMGQLYNPDNHLLMHAMGPIVSSTIGSAIVAGIFISYFLK
ncbi:MAG: sodium ion-translocating decarboxylase subunit beta [Treponema sp.]|nr:sodium ion-translocating decarboxylase subunit beta [Treponema sp.]